MTNWMPEAESLALLRSLFPHGPGGADVMAVLCPAGWAASPLREAFHPTPERQYEEAVRWRENMADLRGLFGKRKDGENADGPARPEPPPLEPLPDREVFLAEARAASEAQEESDEQELGRLVCQCLWDVLSDNHDLILPDGRVRHMGSFRATAGLIADFFYQKPPGEEAAPDLSDFDFSKLDMSYCEFYMGTWAISGRTDLGPVYRLIFERLKTLDHGWQYAFPKLGMVRFGKAENRDGKPEWEGYDPSAALTKEEETAEKEAEFQKLQTNLEAAHQEALEAAKSRPPPLTVLAYRDVFGHWPAGWPPWE